MTSLFLLSILLQPDPRVTLDLPATRLLEIAKRISDQTGEQVKITGPDPGQFVFVKVEKMPFSRLRESLSFVTGGKWTKAGNVWALQTVPEEHFAELEYMKGVRAWLDTTKRLPSLTEGLNVSQLSTLVDLDKSAAILRLSDEDDKVLASRVPAQRLIARTVQLIPTADLLNLAMGSRRVYALHPTSLQKPLPSQFPRLFQDFLAERRNLSRLDPGDGGFEDESEATPPEEGPPRDVRQTATAHLALSRKGFDLSVKLSLFDSKGRYLYSSEVIPLGDPFSEARIESLKAKIQPRVPDSLLPKVSPEEGAFAAEFRALTLSREGLPGQRASMTPAAKAILEGQVKRDLLSLNPSSLFSQFSRASKRQVIAKLNDIALRIVLMRSVYELPLLVSVLAAEGYPLAEFDALKVEDDLICIRPSPVVGRWALSDHGRDTAVRAIREEAAGMPRLEVLSMIAAEEAKERNLFWPALTSGMFTHQGSLIPSEGQTSLLRIFGLLTLEQKRQAKGAGVELTLASLRPNQKEAIRGLLLDCAEIHPGKVEAAGRELSYLEREPTVYLAGVPDHDVTIQVKLTYEPTLMVRTANGRGLKADAESVALLLYRNEVSSAGKLPASFFSGTLGKLEMKTLVGARVTVTHSYSLQQASPDGRERPFSELPPGMLEQAEALVRERKKQDLQRPPPVLDPPQELVGS